MMLAALLRQRFLWIESMAGSEAPAMRWAVFTTLCRAFRSALEQFPYQTVIQLVRMLSMVQR